MTYDEILLETYTEDIAELEDERAGLNLQTTELHLPAWIPSRTK